MMVPYRCPHLHKRSSINCRCAACCGATECGSAACCGQRHPRSRTECADGDGCAAGSGSSSGCRPATVPGCRRCRNGWLGNRSRIFAGNTAYDGRGYARCATHSAVRRAIDGASVHGHAYVCPRGSRPGYPLHRPPRLQREVIESPDRGACARYAHQREAPRYVEPGHVLPPVFSIDSIVGRGKKGRRGWSPARWRIKRCCNRANH